MRLVLDLQACQSEASAGRGVGRYAQGLALALARRAGNDELRMCFSGSYASLAQTIDPFEIAVGRGNLSMYRYPLIDESDPPRRAAGVAIAQAMVRRHWMALQPNVVHVGHVFEGFRGQAALPDLWPGTPGVLRTATLYDLIPMRMPERYLADPSYKTWYLRKLETLRACDHLLAISNATRDDAIALLGVDPSRITTIWGGIDAVFVPPPRDPAYEAALRERHGIRGGFVLYTGGDDARKNLDASIAGFAALPPGLRADLQLVIVCALSGPTRDALRGLARRLAVDDSVVFAGRIVESDLVGLYSVCSAFVFPSLYEGLGLPVLEAMACGAPVIGADNSGTAEVIGRRDALFDADKPDQLAQRLAAVIGDADYRDALRRHGLARSREFSWERTAALAAAALHDAHARHAPRATSVAVEARRPRLALFTPLPPCKSGIADYNVAFLPYLSRHFDIDLYVDDYSVTELPELDRFVIRPHGEFAARRREYDGIVYEMGNSEFHVFMLEHLMRYPGVVVLHDAYLSALYGYIDFNLGRAGTYLRAMYDSHGPRARRYLAPVQHDPDPVGASMVNLPASKGVIDAALGVISHTPFNVELARACYPEGWAAPYRIIPQMAVPPADADVTARAAVRSELGFAGHEFIVCTFGHITWTKNGDVLLDAFARSALASDPAATLVYVGEMARDAFGRDLTARIAASGFGTRVRVTGYVDDAAYRKYLAAADLAVQLRTHTRGGTSKAILDCLAHGVALIVNDAGSFTDYPQGVLLKIGAEPDAADLADAMTRLHARRDALEALGRAGAEHVRREHDPARIAAEYASAIGEMLARGRAASLPATLGELGEALASDPARTSTFAGAAAALHADLLETRFARQRIVVDVSHISDKDHQTGIQRVVRNIVRWLYCSDRAGFDVIAVRLQGARLVEAVQWLAGEGLLDGGDGIAGSDGEPIHWRQGDTLLMLDSSWARIDAYLPLFDQVREHGGKVYCVVYDLLPIRFPRMFVEGGARWFMGWLDKALQHSDGCVCISRAVADELAAYLRVRNAPAPQRLGFWHLGCDFGPAANAKPSERIRKAMRGRTVLMVGTIEPRKNHALVLDAFERLWARGVDTGLCIAGKPGWSVGALISRLRAHPEAGRRLRFVDAPDDDELGYAYAHAAGLLLPSVGEGFGLPLIEAARFDTPILASDIPVFREIAGEHACYFALGDADVLAREIEAWLVLDAEQRPHSSSMPRLSWEQSALKLLEVILDNRWYKLRADATS